MANVTAELIRELRERTGIAMGKCKEALVEAQGDIEEAISYLRKKGLASAVKKEGRETKEGKIATAENAKRVALIEVNAETDFVVKNDIFQKFVDTLASAVAENVPASVDEFLQQKIGGATVDQTRAEIVQSLGENIQVKRFTTLNKSADVSIGIYSHMGGQIVTVVEIGGSDKEVELAKDIAMHVAAESPLYLNASEVPPEVKAHEEEIAREQVKGRPADIMDKIVEGKIRAYYDQVCLVDQKFVKDPDIKVGDLVAKRGKETGKTLTLRRFLRWKVGGQ